MQSFFELAKARYSCRNFNGKPVEREKLVKMIEAASLAPSGCNSQPWSFVVVDRPELVKQVAKCTQVIEGVNKYADDAGAFIIVLEEHAHLMKGIRKMLDSQYFAKGDLGGAAVTICYAAADMGVQSLMIGMYDREELCNLLGLPQEQRFFIVIALGYTDAPPAQKPARKPLDQIMRFA